MRSSEDSPRSAVAGPYEYAALYYAASGVGHPIPIAKGAKAPLVSGHHGRQGVIPDDAQIASWERSHGWANIAIVLSSNVVGIDVDAHSGKGGELALRRGEKAHGVLPVTPRSTARGESNISGIRFFLLESAMDEEEFKGDLGDGSGIEVISRHLRYAVVQPSWHSGVGAQYKWYMDGELSLSGLAILPWSWFEHLCHSCACFEEERHQHTQEDKRYYDRPYGKAGAGDAARHFLERIAQLKSLPIGSRNDYLSRFAGRVFLWDVLVHRTMTNRLATDALTQAALDSGLEADEIEATIYSAKRYAARTYKTREAS